MNTTAFRTWTPNEDLVSHSGSPLNEALVFFSEPPSEIGVVTSAYSNLLDTDTSTNLDVHAFILILLIVSAFLIAILGSSYVIGIGLLLFLLWASWTLFEKSFNSIKTNTFVGIEGVARITKSRSGNPDHVEVIKFADISHVKSNLRDYYVNGGYVRTEYNFGFVHHKIVTFFIAGTHSSGKQTPPANHPYWFGRRAEIAWTEFKVSDLLIQSQATGFVEFPVNQSDFIRVSASYLDIGTNGKVERLERNNIERLCVCSGSLEISRRPGTQTKWYARNRTYRFRCSTIGNASLLFIFFEVYDYGVEIP